jgi:hypothetical protein
VRREDALAGELVHRVGAEIEDLRNFLAVEQDLVLVDHRHRSPSGLSRS